MRDASRLRLISHPLCPYVQRAVIVADEKGVVFERVDIDLSQKPSWFLNISPTGKTPLLQVSGPDGRQHVLFESAAIGEYLDETTAGRLLPSDALERARHRAWVEFASGTLSEIAGLYSAREQAAFEARLGALRLRFKQVEDACTGPWFAGQEFGLVDAAFGPVFRYLDAFERLAGLALAERLPKVAAWRAALAVRPSVRAAVAPDYPERLGRFLIDRQSHVSALILQRETAA